MTGRQRIDDSPGQSEILEEGVDAFLKLPDALPRTIPNQRVPAPLVKIDDKRSRSRVRTPTRRPGKRISHAERDGFHRGEISALLHAVRASSPIVPADGRRPRMLQY